MVRCRRLAGLALSLGPIGLGAQTRRAGEPGWSLGAEAIVVAGHQWLSGIGLRAAVPVASQVRLGFFGAPALRGDEVLARSEATVELAFANPANPRRVSWYGGAGLAADVGRRTDGFILLLAGLEGPVGRSGRWWVDGGVGGGPRVALGARWPMTTRRKRKNGRPSLRRRPFPSQPGRFWLLGAGSGDFRLPLHRLAEPLPERPNLGQLLFPEIRIALGEILHGVVQPLLLMLRIRVDHTTPQDVAEQLVSGLVESGGDGRTGLEGFLLLGH